MLLARCWMRIFLSLCLVTLAAGCATQKKITVGAVASLVEDVAKASYKQSDLKVIREGMPAYLLLMDGMVEAWPDNAQLLLGAAQAYSSFASAFIDPEDSVYANALHTKAKLYALQALELRGIREPASQPFNNFETDLKKMGQKDVPYMFWAAACWGNWINLNMGSMEALAELPRVELLIKKNLELDEGFYYGGPHLFMGILNASRPKIAGGNLELAQEHFLKAIELGKEQFLMSYVYYADFYAKKSFDRELYVATLEKVLQTPADIVPELTLLNTVAHQRAEKMLQLADEYF